MLRLLPVLAEAVGDRKVWPVRSLNALVLRPAGTDDAPWMVRVGCTTDEVVGEAGGFAISYLLPVEHAPWPDARVEGGFAVDRTTQPS